MYFQYPPWHALEYDQFGNVVNSSGLVFAMLDEMKVLLNFTYRIIAPKSGDRGFGIAQAGNEEFNGVVGMIQRGEAQLAASILVITETLNCGEVILKCSLFKAVFS